MIELKEWWDVEYIIEPFDNIKYNKKLTIVIKNHAPEPREFKVGLHKIDVKNQINYIRIKMFLDVSNPIIVTVDKYKKQKLEIPIPRLVIPEEDAKIVISVEKLKTHEKKYIEIFL